MPSNVNITSQQLEDLARIGWRCMEAHELIKLLAEIPPMMSIFVNDEDTEDVKVINAVEIDSSGLAPVLMISIADKPKELKLPEQSTEEEYDDKRAKAMDMAAESESASKMPRYTS